MRTAPRVNLPRAIPDGPRRKERVFPPRAPIAAWNRRWMQPTCGGIRRKPSLSRQTAAICDKNLRSPFVQGRRRPVSNRLAARHAGRSGLHPHRNSGNRGLPPEPSAQSCFPNRRRYPRYPVVRRGLISQSTSSVPFAPSRAGPRSGRNRRNRAGRGFLPRRGPASPGIGSRRRRERESPPRST